jgi:hypothetical protein
LLGASDNWLHSIGFLPVLRATRALSAAERFRSTNRRNWRSASHRDAIAGFVGVEWCAPDMGVN